MVQNTPQRVPPDWWGNRYSSSISHLTSLRDAAEGLILSQPRISLQVVSLAGCLLVWMGYRSSRDMGGALPVSAVMGKWHMPSQPQCPCVWQCWLWAWLCADIVLTMARAGSIGISPGISVSVLKEVGCERGAVSYAFPHPRGERE